jgi:Mn2+/Fe2+ NRAMP family transporter
VKVEGDILASPILHVLLHLTPKCHKLQKVLKHFAIPKWMPFSNVIVAMLTLTFACYFIPHSSIFVAF